MNLCRSAKTFSATFCPFAFPSSLLGGVPLQSCGVSAMERTKPVPITRNDSLAFDMQVLLDWPVHRIERGCLKLFFLDFAAA